MNYPEHEKLQTVKHLSQAQGELLEWLEEKGWAICEYVTGRCEGYHPIRKSTEQILAELHEIDLKKIEQEKRSMLEEMRKANDPETIPSNDSQDWREIGPCKLGGVG